MSFPGLRLCVGVLGCHYGAGHIRYRAGGSRQALQRGMLRGLYLWTFDGYTRFGGNLVPKAVMQGLRFNGDGTTFNPFGTVNIGGTIIIDATGGARNLYSRSGLHGHAVKSPHGPALTSTSDRVHSRFGPPSLREMSVRGLV